MPRDESQKSSALRGTSREEDVEYPLIDKRLTVHWTELVLAGH